jgi:hypothetical protein
MDNKSNAAAANPNPETATSTPAPAIVEIPSPAPRVDEQATTVQQQPTAQGMDLNVTMKFEQPEEPPVHRVEVTATLPEPPKKTRLQTALHEGGRVLRIGGGVLVGMGGFKLIELAAGAIAGGKKTPPAPTDT